MCFGPYVYHCERHIDPLLRRIFFKIVGKPIKHNIMQHFASPITVLP